MRFRRWARIGAVVLAGLLLVGSAGADELRRLVAEGNRLFAEKRFDEALEKYRSAQVESPESAYLYFDIANALARQDKHDEAIADYRKVYSRETPALGAWALYNIGVCQYRQAEGAIGTQDYQKALELLEQCMESNREAMKLSPDDEDPKFNYEQAKRKWKEVLDALKKQQEEQQKQQEQQKQDQQKKQEDQKQEQQKQDQQKQDRKKQDEQKQEQQKKDEQKQQQQKKDQATSQPQPKEDQTTSGTAQAEPQTGEMSPEDAERILNSLPEQTAEEMKRFLMPHSRADFKIEKDW